MSRLDNGTYYQTDGRFVNWPSGEYGGSKTAPRAVNPHKHAARRDEFVDAGYKLIQTRGYEQFSIEDLLGEVGASKGAFYHYFDSKQALLEAVVDRLVDVAMTQVETVVNDASLTSVEKLRAYFRVIQTIKEQQIDFLLKLIEVWYSDDNAIVRQKVRREEFVRVTPHLATIIRQGVREGRFALADPDQMARIVLALILDTGDEAGEMWLARLRGEIDFETVERRFATYQVALGRLLGIAPGELQLIDEPTLRLWFDDVFTKEN